MEFPADRVEQGRAAVIHEIVHVYAPNQNRFLAEGLAVYLHHMLGGNPAYPNFGTDLHQQARRFAGAVSLAQLDAISTPERLQLGQLDERSAYMVTGSFVGFLIETFGLDKFKELYALSPLVIRQRRSGGPTGRYAKVFGKSLDELESDWQRWVSR